MRIGISVTSAFDVADVRVGAQYMIEQARAARDAKLASLFVGDHHVTPRPYYQNSPMLGRLLAEWGDRAAGALYLLPLWNPVLVAEQTATLACINRGRSSCNAASARDERQSSGMGVDIRLRPSMFEESLDDDSRAVARRERHRRRSLASAQEPHLAVAAGADRSVDRRFGQGRDRSRRAPRRCVARRSRNGFRNRASTHRRLPRSVLRHNRTPTTIAIRRDTHVGASRPRRRAERWRVTCAAAIAAFPKTRC